jgi:hypothetical protein
MNVPTPFHVLTPLLKEVKTNGWTLELTHKIENLLALIGSNKIIEMLFGMEYIPSDYLITQASRYERIQMLLFAKERQFPYNRDSLFMAVTYGKVDSIKYLFKEYPELRLSYDPIDLLRFSCEIVKMEGSVACIRYTGHYDAFKYLIENGFREHIVEENIIYLAQMEIFRAEKYQDYSFRFISYIYKEQIINKERVFRILENFKTNKRTCNTINFRKLFEIKPDFKEICYNNSLTEYPYLQEKVNKVKEAIEGEKEESIVLQTSFPIDIIRYVVWKYL